MSDLLAHLDQLFADGPIRFERFMESALYDPLFGYYTANIGSVGGRSADFATTVTVSDSLGKAIGRWIQKQLEDHGYTTVIEIGAGDGSLAEAILHSMGFFLRRKINYRIVEISPVLRQKQRKRLGKKARWYSTIHEAIADLDGAIIFSNELVDAFPVRWFQWNGRWDEIYVKFDRTSGLGEEFRPAEVEMPQSLQRAGQRIERHDSYREWLGSWIPNLPHAALLTIDYGGTAEEIYHRRIAGTLRGYWKHQRIEGGGIYSRFGKQDLTADVNFDDVKTWGEAQGFRTLNYGTQETFMSRWGVTDESLGEAGHAFQVLEQFK